MPEARPCAFLDRDGTLIEECNYLSDPDQVVLLPGVVDGLKALMEKGFLLVILTNQSGIGRGYFPEAAAHDVNQRIIEMLALEGIAIAACYMCPHAPDAQCLCRKPLAGLIDEALSRFSVNLTSSIVIGDKDIDLQLAGNRGLRGFLVTTGHASEHIDWAQDNGFPVFPDILSIARQL
ncbi:HAD family hydrolase [Rhizobium sp. FY34]|uniref:D-glycero-alpha-D-manno-heptose-1,7-bisphosphate 7-phosphatase n=1 Tax=Rhizobium sp. FY34 TaxID=2562309 RepID=UPI0010C0248C|nr:HAD family hydrolase [Rhizobium sp. FY34]